jgi:isopentenyl diphosphate isomerase/L-lactate dehydrogenase-like FMN-dependent dehydrogenase
MRKVEEAWRRGATRRAALGGLAGLLAGSPLLRGQQDPWRDHSRVPGLDELVDAFDFENAAYAKLPREVYDYTAYAGAGEFTKRRNREAFEWAKLAPKGVVDVSTVNTATELLGTKMAYPIMVCPSSTHGTLHPEGEAATHCGATAASNTPMIVSNVSSLTIDKIAAAATGPLWFQLYPKEDLDTNRATLEQAQQAGCQGVVVTVDQQAAYFERSLHDRNLVGGGRLGGRGGTAARRPAAASGPGRYRVSDNRLWYDWKFFDQIRPFFKGPMFAKGILTPEDAKLCIQHGLDGVYVSNHGGRTLDYGPATFEALPEIVDAVGGKVPVVVDSGFRRGADILKALALGAKAVCIGRPQRWALGAFGAPGVQRIFEILQTELVLAMAAAGRPSLASIDRSLVRTDFP